MHDRIDRVELAAFGERLARDLASAAVRYHVKSDQRDILGYESATVQAYIAWITRGVPVPTNLRGSVLLGEWGRGHRWKEQELLQRTSEFYRKLEGLGLATEPGTPS